jgi:hypothetical protein
VSRHHEQVGEACKESPKTHRKNTWQDYPIWYRGALEAHGVVFANHRARRQWYHPWIEWKATSGMHGSPNSGPRPEKHNQQIALVEQVHLVASLRQWLSLQVQVQGLLEYEYRPLQ